MSSTGEGSVTWYMDRVLDLGRSGFDALLDLLGITGDGRGSWYPAGLQWASDREDFFGQVGSMRSSYPEAEETVPRVMSLPVPQGIEENEPSPRRSGTPELQSRSFRRIPRGSMFELVDRRLIYSLTPRRDPLWESLSRALGDAISGSPAIDRVRNTFRPDSWHLTIGSHLLIDRLNENRPVVAGESFLDVSLFGYGVPLNADDAEEYRSALGSIPEVVAFERGLTDILGPVRRFAHWVGI